MSKEKIIVSARQVVDLLEAKHYKDVFVSECKSGATWYSRGLLKLDAWAMPRSWAHPSVRGYEIKVSRSDFLQDDKWHGYLEYCNLFYFVTAPNMVIKSEIPEQAGWIEVSAKGKRLYTRKKAPHREVNIPEEIFRYILMSRADIVPANRHYSPRNKLIFWRDWVKNKSEKKDVGLAASKALQEVVARRIDEVEEENNRVKRENEALTEVREAIEKMGLSVKDIVKNWDKERQVREVLSALPTGLVSSLSQAVKILKKFETQGEHE